MHWQILLSRFNYNLVYRPGSQAYRPDALSQRLQDENDDRLTYRDLVLWPQDETWKRASMETDDMLIHATQTPPVDEELEHLWKTGESQDEAYDRIRQAVKNRLQRFPRDLRLKLTIREYRVDDNGQLTHRGHFWVLDYDPLRMKIMQHCHDSMLSGYPGHNGTSAIVGRTFFGRI